MLNNLRGELTNVRSIISTPGNTIDYSHYERMKTFLYNEIADIKRFASNNGDLIITKFFHNI